VNKAAHVLAAILLATPVGVACLMLGATGTESGLITMYVVAIAEALSNAH